MTRSRSLDRALEDLVYRSAEPPERVRHRRRIAFALIDIVDERRRQEEIGDSKREAGIDWRSCADPDMSGGDATRFLVLGEEVGEVSNAVLEYSYAPTAELRGGLRPFLRAELVQVAAVALAWIEAIDLREGVE